MVSGRRIVRPAGAPPAVRPSWQWWAHFVLVLVLFAAAVAAAGPLEWAFNIPLVP